MFSKIVFSVGLALAFGSGAAVAQQKPVPVENFVKQDQFSDPRLSPDGKHIAIKVRMMRNGRLTPTLTVYTLPDLKIVSTMAMDKDKDTIPLEIRWATNTRLLVTKGIAVGLREEPIRTGEVIAVDLDGKNFQYLYGSHNFKSSTKGWQYRDDYGIGTIESIPAIRNGHALIGTYLWEEDSSSLYDIDTINVIRKQLAQIPAKRLTFHSQRDGTPRFATGYDDEANQVVYRRDDANGEWKKLPSETIGKGFYPKSFTSDNSEFFATVSVKGEPYAVIRESLKTGQRTVLAQDARTNLGLQWHDQGRGPFAVINPIGIPTIRYIDPDSANAKLHKTLSQQFQGSVVNFINFTDDGNKLLFMVHSDRDPGSYYLYDRSAGSADLLFSIAEAIDPEQMSERQPFAFKARDGLELFGYLTMPKNADTSKQKLPMVVMPHGGPFGVADDWYFDNHAQFLASRGYAVLQVNFRGSGGRGETFLESGFRQWGGKIQEDLIDGIKAAINQNGIDAKRICTYGISFGGYSALMLPVREPGMFKCAIGYSGAYDLNFALKEYNTASQKSSLAFYKRAIGDDEAELARQSPVTLADKIKIPVWLIHGGKDKNTPPEHAKRMREALIKAGNPPEWTLEPEEGHGFYAPQRRKELYEKLEAFLAKHIGKAG